MSQTNNEVKLYETITPNNKGISYSSQSFLNK